MSSLTRQTEKELATKHLKDMWKGACRHRKQVGADWWLKFQNELDSIDKTRLSELTIEKVLDLVREQKIVKDQIEMVGRLSKGQRHILVIPRRKLEGQ